MAARNEFNIAAISQILKLLPNLWPDILVAGIKTAEVALERVDFVEGEVAFAQRFNAFHHIEQPAACFQ